MTTITGNGWNLVPVGGPFGTGLRLEQETDRTTGPVQERLVGTHEGSEFSWKPYVVGSAAIAGTGAAAAFAGGPVGSLAGSRGIGTGVGIAIGVAALAGVGLLMWRGQQNASTEYQLTFAQQPDLSGVAPGDVYATLREHHERNAPAIERELETLLAEEKVRSYSGIIGANGFVIDVVNKHRDEVEERLGAIATVGDLVASPLS